LFRIEKKQEYAKKASEKNRSKMMVKKTPDSLDAQKPVGESTFWQNVPHRPMTPVSCST